MKACFPVARDLGLDSRVHSHFGSAPLFLLVDTETRAAIPVLNAECDHGQGRCHPLHTLAGLHVDFVVESGIGPGALAGLQAAGVRVYHVERGSVGEALDAVASGSLPPLASGDLVALGHGCVAGGHEHAHRPGVGAGPGRHRSRGGSGS